MKKSFLIFLALVLICAIIFFCIQRNRLAKKELSLVGVWEEKFPQINGTKLIRSYVFHENGDFERIKYILVNGEPKEIILETTGQWKLGILGIYIVYDNGERGLISYTTNEKGDEIIAIGDQPAPKVNDWILADAE